MDDVGIGKVEEGSSSERGAAHNVESEFSKDYDRSEAKSVAMRRETRGEQEDVLLCFPIQGILKPGYMYGMYGKPNPASERGLMTERKPG